MTANRRLSRLAFTMIFAASFAVAQEPSLAEQAAAARKHASPAVAGTVVAGTVMGHIVVEDYYNEVLGFQIRHIPGWTSMSRGTMNVNEAIGREALGLQAGITQAENRVFGMHDELGSNVMVAIVPVPAGTTLDTAALRAEVTTGLKAQLPNMEISNEPLLLGDSTHRFTGLRGTCAVMNREVFQSLQVVVLNGYAVTITATTTSAEQLQSLLTQLRTLLRWTQASAQ